MNTMGPPPVKPTERPPLITPSASPPPSRFTHRNPDSDGPSPTKRQRLFSTPRLTLPGSSASSSVSRPQSPVDLQKEREASKLRLLDVWAGLAERYNVPAEEDDLVNIRTGKITKDNGFLRKHKALDFGTIAAPTLGPDDEASEEDEEDEYDIDELDAFADENQSEEEEDNQSTMKPPGFSNPFASILKAAEEEDLRQFLQAEQERKALCGSDVDDYEEDECSSEEYASSSKHEGGTESDLESSVEPDFQNDEPGLEQEMTGGEEYGFEQVEERVEAGQSQQDLGRTADLPIPLDFDSEDDELDIWVQDESCIVYPVVKAEPPEHYLSTGEGDDIAEPPAILIHSPPVGKPANKQNTSTKPSIYPKSIKGSQQLYTPPQSQSSSRSSGAPIIDVIDLSSSTESLPPPSVFASLNNSKGKSTKSSSKIPVAIPHSVGQKSNRKHAASKESTTISPDLSIKTTPSTKLQPYVLLTPRHGRHGTARSDPPSGKTKAQTDGLSSEEELPEHANSSPSKASKGKGKAKAVDSPPRPHTDVRRGTTHLKNATTSNNNHGGAVQILSNRKTKFSTQDHKDPSPSKTKDAKQRTEKPCVTSNNEHAKGPPSLPSASTHRKRKRSSINSNPGTSASPTRESDLDNSSGNANDLGHSSSRTSTSRVTLDEERKSGKAKTKSSSRRRERTASSDSDSEFEADSSASESERGYRNSKQQPPFRASVPPALHPYHHLPYPTSHYPPPDYPSIPDPRAQLIITHAMHQLSALVGGSWGPPPHGPVPYTPTHRHHDARASVGPFLTPAHHPHPYPYAYDPNYSNATLPPDSSEVESSPHKQSSSRQKSLVKKSRSRGRRVSFDIDDDERHREMVEGRSSPSPKEKEKGHPKDSRGSSSKKSKSKETKSHQKRDEASSDRAESDYEIDGARGRTPGPSSDRGRRSKQRSSK